MGDQAKKIRIKNHRIRESWEDYRRRVIPRDAPVVQFFESRRAFYAGAQGLLGIILRMLDPGSDEPTEADLAKMDELEAELKQFANDVRAGKA